MSHATTALRELLRRWRWVLALLLVVQLTPRLFEPLSALEVPRDMLAGGDWVAARDMSLDSSAGQLAFRAGSGTPAIATRPVGVSPQADFVELRACVATREPPDAGALMLASVRGGRVDFNRHFRVYALAQAGEGSCVSELLPRLAGDGPALLQLQLADGQRLVLSGLEVRALRERPGWQLFRRCGLTLGIVLLAAVFLRCWRERPGSTPWARSRAGLGLLVFATIIFGCCISVALKAQIFALLTGGRDVAAPAAGSLLTIVFPTGGFPLFSLAHALLFAAAGLLLVPLRRHSAADLLLLAPATETLQILVPGRGPGLDDVLIDWSGLALALGLLLLLRRARRVDLVAKK